MRVKVLKPFADKITHAMYGVGTIIDVDKDRADDMVSRGLASSLEPKSAPKKATKKSVKKED
jgi:hypothetical protein